MVAGSVLNTSTTPGTTVSMETTSSSLTATLMSTVSETLTSTVSETTKMMGSTDMLTSSSSEDDVTAVASTLGFFTTDGQLVNSTMPADGNFSQNVSQDVDLDALNLSMVAALIPTIVYLALLMVVGGVGNTVVFLVYYRRFKPSATRTYVLTMSVCDLLANTFSLPSEIVDIRFNFTFDLPWLCRGVRGFNSFLTLTSAFVLVAVAMDRYHKICRPLDKQRPLSRYKLYVLICALASLALSVVFFALNGSQTVLTGEGNTTGITCSVADAFVGTLFPLIYNILMALSFLLCVAIMTVSYIFIALKLWRHKQKQQRISGPAPTASASRAIARGPAGKGLGPIVEDTSSGPVHDSHLSDTSKSASTAELIPMKAAGATTTGQQPRSRNPAAGGGGGGPEKQVLLLSVRNLNYEGPTSSVEDSDEGCFSMETTCSISVDVSRDGGQGSDTQVGQDARDEPQLQTQIVNETRDERSATDGDSNNTTGTASNNTTGTGSAEEQVRAESARENAGLEQPGATPAEDGDLALHHDSPATTSSADHTTDSNQDSGENPTKGTATSSSSSSSSTPTPTTATTTTTTTARPDITTTTTTTTQPTAAAAAVDDNDDSSSSTSPSSPHPHHPHRSVNRSSSLLQKLLTPKRGRHLPHQEDDSQGNSSGGSSLGRPSRRCKIPKKRHGTSVKSIPSSTTLMMFVLTATFVVNYLPHLIIITLRALDDTFGKGLIGAALNVYNVSLRSYYMNSAANSLVYGFCSARFRQECRNLFAARK